MRTLAPLPPLLLDLAEAQEGLLSATQCDRHGVGTDRRSRLVRAGRWRRVTRGVVDTVAVPPGRRTVDDVPGRPVPPLVATRVPDLLPWPPGSGGDRLFGHLRRRAAWLGMLGFGPDGVAVGSSALALHGVEGLPHPTAPQVALPAASRRDRRPGLPLRQFDAGMTTATFGDRRTGERRIASVEWAVAQAVPELPLGHGLAVLDSALRLGALDRAGLRRSHDHARGRRGVAARHPLWDLADPRAESPLESLARWQCIADGVPPDVPQLPVHAPSGRVLARCDLGWDLGGGRWLVVETDGHEWHDGDAGQVRRDRERDNDLATAGVTTLRFDAGHVRRGVVGRRVRTHLARLRRTGG